MLKATKFWYKKNDTYLSNSLYPLSLLFRFGTKIRNFVSRKSSSGIPVICIGNIVVEVLVKHLLLKNWKFIKT